MTPNTRRSALSATIMLCCGLFQTAHAEEPALRCRLFEAPLETSMVFDTSDANSQVGQWVKDQASRGWQVHSVQFSIGQKPTGYPVAYRQLCLVKKVTMTADDTPTEQPED